MIAVLVLQAFVELLKFTNTALAHADPADVAAIVRRHNERMDWLDKMFARDDVAAAPADKFKFQFGAIGGPPR
jgi:hypothetical protein